MFGERDFGDEPGCLDRLRGFFRHAADLAFLAGVDVRRPEPGGKFHFGRRRRVHGDSMKECSSYLVLWFGMTVSRHSLVGYSRWFLRWKRNGQVFVLVTIVCGPSTFAVEFRPTLALWGNTAIARQPNPPKQSPMGRSTQPWFSEKKLMIIMTPT